jgi:hypothetical protein
MSAPQYVPHRLEDRPRTGEPLPPAKGWRPLRPGDLAGHQPAGDKLGSQGPDQGYVLKLLGLFSDKLDLAEGEDRHDAEAGVVGVALKRASRFGRAPVVYDVEVAYRVFGYLDPPVPELVELRRRLFTGVSHSYEKQRAIADAVPSDTLRLTPAYLAERHAADWRSLLAV